MGARIPFLTCNFGGVSYNHASTYLYFMTPEQKIEMSILLDEKAAATQILKELKKHKDTDPSYKDVKNFRNRVCKRIREIMR